MTKLIIAYSIVLTILSFLSTAIFLIIFIGGIITGNIEDVRIGLIWIPSLLVFIYIILVTNELDKK